MLIDLSGFTEGNRLLTFALKPAALQMSWIGFVGTTGLQQMDYYIAHDHLMAPGELDAIFTEKLVSLPSAKIFEYSAVAPEVSELPALKNGYLTLGNFNRPQKLTPAILDCWANILRTLPHARLLFAYMNDERMIDGYRLEMTRRGVKPEQLDFRMKQSFADYLAMHNEVDILLDCTPLFRRNDRTARQLDGRAAGDDDGRICRFPHYGGNDENLQPRRIRHRQPG